uniref:ATP synthase subunit 5, mitochondrial n=1 Tax=Helicotheca tamesis TaxID=374047 RepID=A0A7S2HDJ6_9STRA|mmetsp:Transcript_17223/g.23681  ORF Transcript_17223/g.23681 Transcript_17223/m.23681 type:complete len:210 (+) Transcript_17223:78-707(+)|eukprot:CAMPEP_0185725584 /NCGR_PEP_ID=MMETSP1171-20130828/1800_1 /TAXON_ID=374046 /ORGANISM="Helicotheca tamensis, Strain CCMP826" /LENGTH=209 /DNA_ID=CAMNT_0028393745 /DNA_START=84 /DNA_END=713 /DNA_ORIENTATION=+
MLSSTLRTAATRTATRTTTRALSSDAHKPPIDLYGLHARYANAAYVAASKSSTLDAVESELLAIKASATSSPAFKTFLENPLISRDEKEAQVKDMLAAKVSPVTLNLMSTLAGNARLAETPKIVDSYVQLMKAKRGEVEATIISADPLTKAQTEAVAAAMKNQVGEGKTVVLSTEVDPSILGGLQVQIGDQFLDLSVGSKIDAVSRMPV